jgi:Alpha/beta hydrolase domain
MTVDLELSAAPYAGGRAFGDVGPYEVLSGEARFAFEPRAPANAMITDLQLAERDARGMVCASADVRILRPANAERGNGALFADVPNRGNSIFERMTEPGALGPDTRVSEGFLLQRGYTIVTCGWQHDIPRGGSLFGLTAPQALVEQGERLPVTGIGFLALRDLVAHLKRIYTLEFAIAMGASQTGRWLRHLVQLGCYANDAGELVIDGVLAIAAGARFTEANWRYGAPSEQGARSLQAQRGSVTTERRPRVFELNTSSEYCSSAAPEHVSAARAYLTPDGTQDLDLPEHLRVYLMASTQHAPSPLPLSAPPDATHFANTVDYKPFVRAAIANLRDWIQDGVEPPPSRYPRLGDGTLVNERSAVDADGNEIAGIRHPDVSVPLATFTGWNPSRTNGKLLRATGSTIPFTPTEIKARYASREDYVRQVLVAANALVEQRYLLAEDIERVVTDSKARWEGLQPVYAGI